jgi:hypothetical protein
MLSHKPARWVRHWRGVCLLFTHSLESGLCLPYVYPLALQSTLGRCAVLVYRSSAFSAVFCHYLIMLVPPPRAVVAMLPCSRKAPSAVLAGGLVSSARDRWSVASAAPLMGLFPDIQRHGYSPSLPPSKTSAFFCYSYWVLPCSGLAFGCGPLGLPAPLPSPVPSLHDDITVSFQLSPQPNVY